MKDPIVQIGAEVLRQKASPVPKKDIAGKAVQAVIARMKKALVREEFGVAIAAPQIGEPLRIFVIAGKAFVSDEETKGFSKPAPAERGAASATDVEVPADMVFINPKIIRQSRKKVEMSEGCLSVRGMYGTVMRHEKATVEALDETGKPFTYHGSGLIGHIFQHECDHLDGVLYVDKATHVEEDEDMKVARQKVKEKHGI